MIFPYTKIESVVPCLYFFVFDAFEDGMRITPFKGREMEMPGYGMECLPVNVFQIQSVVVDDTAPSGPSPFEAVE